MILQRIPTLNLQAVALLCNSKKMSVSKRFRDDPFKLSGALEECWWEYIAEYKYRSREFDFTMHQVRILSSLAKSKGRTVLHYEHYREGEYYFIILPQWWTRSTLSSQIEQDRSLFTQPLKQQVYNQQSITRSLTGKSIGKDNKAYPSRTKKLKESRTEYLRSDIIGHSWERDASSRLAAEKTSYEKLYSQLEAFMQQD